MSKYTPGPWRVNGRFVMALKEKTVCEVPQFGVIHGKVDAANARLIAAAPELLEALRLAQSIIGHPDDAHSKLIDAAIAKTEGQQ